MIWNSVADFAAMGGYGLYVWGSYGGALLLMTLEPFLAARRRRHQERPARAVAASGGM